MERIEEALAHAQRLLYHLHSRPLFNEPDLVNVDALEQAGYSRGRVRDIEEELDRLHSDLYFGRLQLR